MIDFDYNFPVEHDAPMFNAPSDSIPFYYGGVLEAYWNQVLGLRIHVTVRAATMPRAIPTVFA